LSYFPERRSGIDPAGIADALSESLSNQYGQWTADPSYLIVKLDPHAAVGNSAIMLLSYPAVATNVSWTAFQLVTPLNLSLFEKFQFLIAAQIGPNYDNLKGTGRIRLVSQFSYAEANFQFLKGSVNDPVSYTTKTFTQNDFTVEPGGNFDWSQITGLYFFFDTQNINMNTWDGYKIYFDGGPFFLLSSTIPKLGILAEDINGKIITFGKHMQLVSPSGGTESLPVPWGPLGVSVGTWTVTILDDDFVKWKDGDTNKTRAFSVGVGQTVTATAVFQSAPPNGGGGGANIPLLVGSASIIAVALIYLLTRKR